MKFIKSEELYKIACNYVPMGTSTFSKNPHLYTIGAAPLYVASAEGARIVDIDGNEFIDYMMALSIMLLGYSNQEVNDAAKDGIDKGLLYTLSCPEESMLAKRITELVPCADMVRFVKNGSDSCEGAIKLARAYTGKLKIMTVGGYHGFHDWFIASTIRNRGIPDILSEWVIDHPYNDIEKIENTIKIERDQIACLIMEPVINQKPKEGFLEKIREISLKNNIILIFDEMKTGFRMSIGGAQQYFNVIPDLAIFGKALANGFPLSALTGKKKIMSLFEDENIFLSGSYATERASLKAALKTLEIIERDKVIDYVWEIGNVLKKGLKELIVKYSMEGFMEVIGYAPMIHLIINDYNGYTVNQIKSYMQQECAKRNILHFGVFHPSYAHTKDDISYTIQVYDKIFLMLNHSIKNKTLIKDMKGKVISSFGVRDSIKK